MESCLCMGSGSVGNDLLSVCLTAFPGGSLLLCPCLHLMRRVDSLEKDSDAGRDWGQKEKGTTEDEMASLTRWM